MSVVKKNAHLKLALFLVFPLAMIMSLNYKLYSHPDEELLYLSMNAVKKNEYSSLKLYLLKFFGAKSINYNLGKRSALEFAIYSKNLNLITELYEIAPISARDSVLKKIRSHSAFFDKNFLEKLDEVIKNEEKT